MVDSKLDDALQERIEKDKRKLNLLFVNVQESVGEREEKIEKDKKKVQDMMKEIMSEEEAKKVIVRNPVRLGATNAGSKPRMLRIEVQSEEIKWNIIRNASKLNTDKDWSDPNRRYINPDYTLKEREANRKVREELKERVRNGERNLKIRGGKVVKIE